VRDARGTYARSVDEERLLGGNTNAEIVRIGDTVRRPVGHWSSGVHALLEHLDGRGYDGAPKLLGLDAQGREVLSFVPGSVVWPDHFALVQSDSALAEVAATIRRYHDAAAGFRSDRFTWSDRGGDPRGPHEILCHGDLAPWNLVRRDTEGWAFIDWDLAAPGRLAWDLSWALLTFTPLMPDSALTERETLHRIAGFGAGYGKPLPSDVLAVAVERCSDEAERIERQGAAGVEPFAHLLAEGHAKVWRSAAVHIEANRTRWQLAVTH
jgi:hypothetical protein